MPIFMRLAVHEGRFLLDAGAQVEELALDVLVAATDVMDAADGRAAVGSEGAEDERGAGAQVAHHELAAVEGRGPGDGGVMGVLDLDPGTHLAEVRQPLEAILEDRLVDGAPPPAPA